MKPYYESDGITIYCSDCREIDLVGDLIVADPPYNQTSLAWDRWPAGWVDAAERLAKSMWVFGSLRMFMQRQKDFSGWKMSQDIVWEKHNGSSFHADRFRRVHETAAHFYQGRWSDIYHETPKTMDATARTVRKKTRPTHMGHIEAKPYRSEDGGPRLQRSVIYARSSHGHAENETQKPVAFVRWLIEYGCPKNGTVLSLFAGSGTDLVAARELGRRAIGIEIREEQCEVAARRLEQQILRLAP